MDLNKIPDRKRKTEATRTNTNIIKNTGDKTDVNDYQISMINILSEKADRCDNVQKSFEDLKRQYAEQEEKLTEKENHIASKNEESQNIVVKQDKVTKLLENIKKKHEKSESNKNFSEEESEFMDLNKIPDRKRKTEATRTNTKIIKNTGDKTDVNDYQISMINILS